MAKVVSVVSGKGGAGKSLLTAVIGRALAREGQRVLLVDLDIFVRGLTVLVFASRRTERRDGLTTSDLLGVFSSNSATKGPVRIQKAQLLTQRFLECDLLPAVTNIAAPLDYDDKALSDEQFCNHRISAMIRAVSDDYDYILLDNRAGMDSLVAAACKNADIILTVAEDDEVGRQTNVNLVRFLHDKRRAKIAYTIINKGRHIRSYDDIGRRTRQRPEFSMVGVVPFDLEVLDEFGSDAFWTSITSTLYFRAVIDAWNNLADAENLAPMSPNKYNFPPKIFMRASEGRFTLFERMLRVYSVLFILAGAGIWLYKQALGGRLSTLDLASIVSIGTGALTLFVSTAGIQGLLRGTERRDK